MSVVLLMFAIIMDIEYVDILTGKICRQNINQFIYSVGGYGVKGVAWMGV